TVSLRDRSSETGGFIKAETVTRVGMEHLGRAGDLAFGVIEAEERSDAGLRSAAEESLTWTSWIAEAADTLSVGQQSVVAVLQAWRARYRTTEEAIDTGLRWLALHQAADGHWSLHEFRQHSRTAPLPEGELLPSDKCTGQAKKDDVAATALALLPFLGAGHTHRPAVPGRQGPYQQS